MREAVPPLHDVDPSAAHEVGRGQAVHFLALVDDRALRDVAAFGLQKVGNRFQRGRLAGAIGTEDSDDLALGQGQRNALQHENDVIVDHLDVVDGEKRGRGLRGGLV